MKQKGNFESTTSYIFEASKFCHVMESEKLTNFFVGILWIFPLIPVDVNRNISNFTTLLYVRCMQSKYRVILWKFT